MKTKISWAALILLGWSAMPSGRAADGATNVAVVPKSLPPPYAGCAKIFNGRDFDGWVADASTWSLTNGAMRGVAGTSRLAYTKKDYGSFRLIFTARMNPVNRDHLGVLFWGDRPKDPAKPKIDEAG